MVSAGPKRNKSVPHNLVTSENDKYNPLVRNFSIYLPEKNNYFCDIVSKMSEI